MCSCRIIQQICCDCSEQSQNRPAYHLASDLIRSTVDALEPYIQTVCINTFVYFKPLSIVKYRRNMGSLGAVTMAQTED